MRLSLLARVYLWLVVWAAAAFLLYCVLAWRGPVPTTPLLMGLLVALAIVAIHFPLMLTPRYKVNAAIAVYFAALLLFGVPAAMLLVGASQLLGGATLGLRRAAPGKRLRSMRSVIFNTGQLMIATGLGGLVYYALLSEPAPASLGRLEDLWAIPIAAATMYLANSAAVAVMVGLQRNQNPAAVFRAAWRADALEFTGLFLIGLVTALLGAQYPWAPLVLVLPTVVIYLALKRTVQLVEEMQQRERETALLDEASRLFNASLDLAATFTAVVELTGRQLGEVCSLFLVEPEQARLYLAACHHADPAECDRRRARLEADPPSRGEGYVGTVAAGGPAVLLGDIPAGARVDPREVDTIGLRSWLCVPLRDGEHVLGVLTIGVAAPAQPLTERDLRTVEAIAERAATAIAHARLHDQVAHAAADLRAVLESVEQGVIVVDRAGRIRFANQRVGDLMGLDVRELVGRVKSEVAGKIIAPRTHDPAAYLRRLRRLAEHPELASTDEVVLSRPGPRILACYSGPVRRSDTGALVGQIHVYTDVTDERRLERAKGEFLATASHELKTPITTLGGYLELLQRQVARLDGGAPTRLTRYVGTAQGELERLHRLSDDLVEVAAIEAGRLTLHPEPADLAGIVRETVERAAHRGGPRRRAHTLTCHATEELPGHYDPLRLGQVFTNLLENALKYSPDGGEVIISAERLGDEAVVSVRDRGIGVPPEERERLFEPFYRAANASDGSPEGLGLGLHISRGIVEGHGGRIWIEGAPDGGSVFRVALPLGERSRAVAAHRSADTPAVPQPNVGSWHTA